jgi:hypothetical protein
MTWKSYAAMSGAGLLATYLVSAPPAIVPEGAPATRPAAENATRRADDIEQQAARLGSRVRTEIEYQPPARNPFRFGGRSAAPRSPVSTNGAVDSPPIAVPQIAPPPAPPPPIRLTGIALDTVEGERRRMAILLTPEGVVTAREGGMAGAYRVTRIEEEAVEVVGPDGTPRRLAVRP